MKRPPTIGGRRLPKAAGRCALCHAALGDPRDSAVTLVYPTGGRGNAAFKTVCLAREGCQRRQRIQAGLPAEELT